VSMFGYDVDDMLTAYSRYEAAASSIELIVRNCWDEELHKGLSELV